MRSETEQKAFFHLHTTHSFGLFSLCLIFIFHLEFYCKNMHNAKRTYWFYLAYNRINNFVFMSGITIFCKAMIVLSTFTN